MQAVKEWKQVFTGGKNIKCSMRRIERAEIEKINQLLVTRDLAKKEKDFKRADDIATTLQSMDICYNDDKHEWYPRARTGTQEAQKGAILPKQTQIAVPPVPGERKKRKKPPSWQKRNARQGLKNKLKKTGLLEGDTEGDETDKQEASQEKKRRKIESDTKGDETDKQVVSQKKKRRKKKDANTAASE
jgi:hypothetical protein